MAKDKPPELKVQAFADHHVITQPNPLRKVMRLVDDKNFEDPVARAEKALAGLSDEFAQWMAIECDRLAAAHAGDQFLDRQPAGHQHRLRDDRCDCAAGADRPDQTRLSLPVRARASALPRWPWPWRRATLARL